MKRRYVVIGLALIAALAIGSNAFGISSSLKKAIKKEVAKQLKKKTGPAGAPGAPGATGAAGTARAYGRVNHHASVPCAPNCQLSRSKGIAAVTHPGALGLYCVDVPGISDEDVSVAVTVDWSLTSGPEGNADAQAASTTICPDPTDFAVRTERQQQTDVRNAADNGSISIAGNAVPDDDVAFQIVIP